MPPSISSRTTAPSGIPSQVGESDVASTVINSRMATLNVSRVSQPAESLTIQIHVFASYNGSVGRIKVTSEIHVEKARPCAPVKNGIRINVSPGQIRIVSEISSVTNVHVQSGALKVKFDAQAPLAEEI